MPEPAERALPSVYQLRVAWRDPEDENVHLEVSVRDRADGRFVPGLRVTATLTAPGGDTVGPVELPLLWHPMLYHYGRNLTAPADGQYTLPVHIDPPTFMRHDEVNGRRFAEPVDVEFRDIRSSAGRTERGVGRSRLVRFLRRVGVTHQTILPTVAQEGSRRPPAPRRYLRSAASSSLANHVLGRR
jgi:hypothetical protein